MFFHDSADSKQTGFFSSIFGLFGNKEDIDEEYQELLAKKFATLEVDTDIEALKKVPDDYEVPVMPYIIAYHKNKEIWREMPSKDSPEIIENLIKDSDKNAKPYLYPPVHTPFGPGKVEESFVRTVTPDGRREVIVTDTITNPNNSTQKYTINRAEIMDPDFGHMARYGGPVRGEPRVVYRDNPSYSVRDGSYRGVNGENPMPSNQMWVDQTKYTDAQRRVDPRVSQTVTRGQPTSTRTQTTTRSQPQQTQTNRKVVYTDPKEYSTVKARNSGTVTTSRTAKNDVPANDWSVDRSYGPSDVEEGITVRKYDDDKYSP